MSRDVYFLSECTTLNGSYPLLVYFSFLHDPHQMALSKDRFAELKSLVSPSEIINNASPDYAKETSTWDSARNYKPQLLLRPTSIESLAKIVGYLYKTDLDFAVRSKGFGNGSAKDVLISLTAFDDFEYDAENKEVLLGVGQDWASYYRKMEEAAPDMTGAHPLGYACRFRSIPSSTHSP
jgi:hypothetical protein